MTVPASVTAVPSNVAADASAGVASADAPGRRAPAAPGTPEQSGAPAGPAQPGEAAETAPPAPQPRRGQRERGAPREPGICRLNRIPILECGEELVDLRTFCTGITVKANPSLIRKSVAEMVQRAQDSLPEGYWLRVHTALRTFEMQSRGYFGHLEKLRGLHPEWSLAILRREANKFWHPPDQIVPPGHCTGGAVDVTLINAAGEEYDLRSTVKPDIDANPTWIRGLTPEAHRNRQILIRAMQDAGFSNCADEWWHWSYGDNGWAARLGREAALFGVASYTEEMLKAAIVEPPPAEADAGAPAAEEARQPEGESPGEAVGTPTTPPE